jgi:hypothetical protein
MVRVSGSWVRVMPAVLSWPIRAAASSGEVSYIVLPNGA